MTVCDVCKIGIVRHSDNYHTVGLMEDTTGRMPEPVPGTGGRYEVCTRCRDTIADHFMRLIGTVTTVHVIRAGL